MIGDGTDLESRRPQGLASLQALDAKTGKPLWDSKQRAKIRSLDREIQYALLGPDEDGDGLDDIYVVTPMVKSQSYVFVDILSGVTGRRLRTVHSEIPVCGGLQTIQKPFFLETAQEGKGLVIAARPSTTNWSVQRLSTVVMSTATGELLNIGDQLEHPVAADGDGDGLDDLFLLKPRDRSKPFRTNQLVSLKSASGGIRFAGVGLNRADPRMTLMDDVDGDGVRDLLRAPFGDSLTNQWPPLDVQRRVVSGATGKELLTWADPQHFDALYSAKGDFDHDGVDDFLATRRSGDYEKMFLFLFSGAKGNILWQKPSTVPDSSSDATANASDINGDGQLDLLLFHHFSEKQSNPSRFRLTCYEGGSGDELWHYEVAPTSNLRAFNSYNYSSVVLDINDDGYADVLCPSFNEDNSPFSVAINGKTGKPIWKLPSLSAGSGRPQSDWQSDIIVSDQNQASVFVSAWEGKPGNKRMVYLSMFDLANGAPVSSWSTEGRFSESKFVGYRERSPTLKVPLAIADGERRLAGIMLENNRKKELVVLDYMALKRPKKYAALPAEI